MRTVTLILSAILFSSCMNVSMVCPDKVSTVTYRGITLTGNTAISCVPGVGGGDLVSVTGLDLLSLASALAPLVGPILAGQKKTMEQQGVQP